MTLHRLAIFAGLLLCTAQAAAQQPAGAPLDLIRASSAPYVSTTDPLGLPMKVRSLGSDPYKFWRGAREFFFQWCKTHAGEWLADSSAAMPCHGDPHVGNIGAYSCDASFGKLAFGMVDFDDSHRLPFQYELLQGAITFRLIAQQNHVTVDETKLDSLLAEMIDCYRCAAKSDKPVAELLADEPWVTSLLKPDEPYDAVVAEYTQRGRFRATIGKSGKIKELLQPASQQRHAIAEGLAGAVVHSPRVRELLRYQSVKEFEAQIKDEALRTRLGSSGSQGLNKYLVLLHHPLTAHDGDAILYLKQQIPAAAERVGFSEREPRLPGRRCAQDMQLMLSPQPYLCSWTMLGGGSYWVSLFEPWSEELDANQVTDAGALVRMMRIWGTATGATHRDPASAAIIADRTRGPRLREKLRQLSADYLVYHLEAFAAFGADPRTQRLMASAEAAIPR